MTGLVNRKRWQRETVCKGGFELYAICREVLVISLFLAAVAVALPSTGFGADPSLMLHNSTNTGSDKWGGDWGTATGQYGLFACGTCHDRSTSNIKRVKTSVTAPSGSFPGQGNAITFLDANDASSDFGDDSTPHSNSDKICEVCHSQNKYHNDDRALNTDNAHYNNADCVSCHKHQDGFKATCYACHGGGTQGTEGANYWPDASGGGPENDTPGRHKAHIDALLTYLGAGYNSTVLLEQADNHTTQLQLCAYCHANPGGGAAHKDTNTDTAFANIWDMAADADGSMAGGNCSNINCHNNKATGTGTYGWTDAGTSACIMCHNDVTNNGNATGLTHTEHANESPAIACGTCHDGATDWVGNVKPAADHLSGTLEISGTETLSYGGALPLATSFGSCAVNDCHSDGAGGPAAEAYTWGTATGAAACTDCHGLYPATNAHDAHYNAKGWTADGSNCGACHDTTAGNHFNGGADMLGTIGWASVPKTCSSAPAGCHNGATSPAWDTVTPIACTDCHSAGGTNSATVANPVSGLHYLTAGGTTAHDEGFGDLDVFGCEDCHVKASITGHWDGTASATADYTKAAVGITSAMYTDAGGVAATRGTCSGTSELGGCHSDGGNWTRQWSTDADVDISLNPNPGQAVCNVCHGQYASMANSTGWNAGTVHYRSGVDGANEDKGIAHIDPNPNECEDCHAYDSAGGNHNSNDMIDFSDAVAAYDVLLNTDRWYCANCHNDDMGGSPTDTASRTFPDSLAFPNAVNHVTGVSVPEGACHACHGDSATGAYWPDTAPETADNAGSEDDAGEHVVHMAALAKVKYGESLAVLVTDTGTTADVKQKTLCAYCHANPGTDGDHSGGDDAEVTQFQRIWDGSADGGAVAGFGYDYADPASSTCSNIDCHSEMPAPAWYGGTGSNCLNCHTKGGANTATAANPASGLHNLTTGGTVAHDENFGSGYGCETCHDKANISGHFNGIANSGDFTGAEVGVDTATLYTDAGGTGASRGSCAGTASLGSCHSDGGYWGRLWSTDADDTTAYDITSALPARCTVCHGVFGTWAAGSSHAGTFGGTGSTAGNTHNSQNPTVNPGAACVDCHVDGAGNHGDNLITLNNDPETDPDPLADVDPVETVNGTYCAPCHDDSILPPDSASEMFPGSDAFGTVHVDGGPNYPVVSCFSGAQNCHGDASNNWWPAAPDTDPAQWNDGSMWRGYPNRIGAHVEHTITLGTLIAGGPPGQDDLNATCRFCHPMVQDSYGVWKSIAHRDGVTDLYGGDKFDGADYKGIVSSGNPAVDPWTSYDVNPADGYLYQLDNPFDPGSLYPLDKDGTYRQYLYDQRGDSTVNHGTCSNIDCHSNAPFTPAWYGDEQPPGLVGSLAAATHDMRGTHEPGETDDPGSVLLTWTAPGDNGLLDGTAYEYRVRYRDEGDGAVTLANWDDAATHEAGGVPSVLRMGQPQEMVVEGLVPGQNYFFGVRTEDQEGNLSQVAATGAVVPAHADDVKPIFWGLDKIEVHDEGGMLHVAWDPAKDHSLPLTYNIWHTTHSLKSHLAKGGDLRKEVTACYNEIDASYFGTSGGDYCLEWETTGGISYMEKGLTTGDLYNFIVRAEDNAGNMDDNAVVQMAMPASAPLETVETKMYLVDSGTTMVEETNLLSPAWPGAGSFLMTDTDVVVLTLNGPLARESEVAGISFDIEIVNPRRDPVFLSAEFGYMDPTFVRLGSLTNQDVSDSAVAVGKKATRVQKFSLSSYHGIVPVGKTLALRLDRWDASSGTTLTLNYGTATAKGQLLANVQSYNHAASGVSITNIARASGGYVDINWSASSANDAGQTVHYDVYGSADGGTDGYPYVIGLGLDDIDRAAGLTWDTVGDGLTAVHDVQVKVETGDGYQYEEGHVTEGQAGSGTYAVHTISESNTLTGFDNSQDQEPPAPLDIKTVEARPKQGSVYLEWTAVGNDGYNHGTRASYYDVRYTSGDIVSGYGEADFTAATQAEGEPVPQFSGSLEKFELLGLAPDGTYTVAMKACDSGEDAIEHNGDDNCGTLGAQSVFLVTGGPESCGFCHSTPPDEPSMAGSHLAHGYTLDDCAKCHGAAVTSYDGRHYNGAIDIGWARNSTGTPAPLVQLFKPTVAGENDVTITQTTDGGDVTIYMDTDGAGGYNAGDPYVVDQVNGDSGQCINFGTANVTGCHGPFNPYWATGRDGTKVEPECADCHGSKEIVNNLDPLYRGLDPYDRVWDDNVGGDPSDDVMAAPPIDNHGLTAANTKYVGAHEVHLNSSFRFAKGDSCRLCHKDTMYSGLHADGNVDIVFDASADQDPDNMATESYVGGTKTTVATSCGYLSTDSCHDTNNPDPATWPKWDVEGAQCDSCHGMAQMGTIPHVSDNGAQVCTWCHVAGHPQSPDGITPGDPATLLVNNNPAVGINYRSGGIHLRKLINGRDTLNNLDTVDTLAEICWACHEDQLPTPISEWNGDDGNNNAAVEPYPGVGQSMYDFGQITPTSWVDDAGVGATWTSGKVATDGAFGYKTGTIQSIHSTDPSGQATITWNAADQRWDETLDPAHKIRCTNCHDVHDLNKTPGDTVSGQPYLRGTWKSNPYEEDGAPWNKTYTLPANTASDDYGPVPRGNTDYNELGGFYIDQNNVRPGTTTPAHYPTSGWTVQSSAGLCVLCHSDDVNAMDKIDDTGKFVAAGFTGSYDGPWYGENGHSNSALGGTFTKKVNIFDYTHGRDVPVHITLEGQNTNEIWDMGVQDKVSWTLDPAQGGVEIYGPRSAKYLYLTPQIGANYAYAQFNWGVSVDADTIDTFYHQFSCSKCHNPHASRLPKLMITNCLDVTHNLWDDNQGSANSIWDQGSDSTKDTAYWNSAQNCHRYDGTRTGIQKGGWNKVTPWVNPN